MDFTTALFYVFAAILVLAATQVITARSPVHAALFLVLSFFSAAGIWMLLQAEFLAIVLVLVYVGAVMVLFLFVVMMLDINMDKLREGFWGRLPLAAIVGLVIAFEMSAVLLKGFLRPDNAVPANAANVGNTKVLGIEIFTNYVLAFEVAAAILFLAIVAAVALTLRRRKDSKYFDPAAAVKVKRNDRVRLVNMKAESDRANGAAAEQSAENTGA
ncbi:NADH-quinone oxidoreductase subunit J [Undibacterium cyanobacteriorum]|uniref:NADH-quinone oxidoreductase subunit J n=1 Tax=Undibacterium cyanobacteriorum TaxID=3073561 RepID=A0ABY9RMI2_9BURK|nr:NADH-quinone oxidoreductase subunit J [Undibacterium sp. 20NA77.5]WMW82171.1 NADH-quinone oxidoreductase subunit J [Undibacterium sp. 20NA77.5]